MYVHNVKTCTYTCTWQKPFYLPLAPTICPWVSEDVGDLVCSTRKSRKSLSVPFPATVLFFRATVLFPVILITATSNRKSPKIRPESAKIANNRLGSVSTPAKITCERWRSNSMQRTHENALRVAGFIKYRRFNSPTILSETRRQSPYVSALAKIASDQFLLDERQYKIAYCVANLESVANEWTNLSFQITWSPSQVVDNLICFCVSCLVFLQLRR